MKEDKKLPGMFLGHTACPRCGSKDNLALYKQEDGEINGTCYGASCDNSFIPSSEIDQNVTNAVYKKPQRNYITPEQLEWVEENTQWKGYKYRGISDSILKLVGIRTQLDEDGKVIARYYPAHFEGKLVGYKRRFHPKDFAKGPLGYAKSDCDLLGQNVFKQGGKYVLVVGGEEDLAAAAIMLRSYQVKKGWGDMEPIAVVSPLIGEGGSKKQIQKAYEYLDSFEKIILGFDNDKAGKKAMKDIAKILPQNKVHIAEWPVKDPNKCLTDKVQAKFIQAFYNAKKFSPAGVLTSSDLFDFIIQRAMTEKIPLPPFLKALQDMLAGGIPLAYIVNILSASGQGKSTVVNELVYYWAFSSPHRVGIVSLEATAGEYGENLLSRHLGKKIALIPTVEGKLEYLNSPYVKQRAHSLWMNEQGEPRFFLVDDRGDISILKKKIEYLIMSCDCKVIVIDPLQDILDEISTEEEAQFMRWQKKLVASHEVSFININHARKNQGGAKANSRGADLTEEDIHGSSAIFKSGGINIILIRDKLSEDPIERNSTRVILSKARGVGNTGPAGTIYYDNATHTLHDKDTYMCGSSGSYEVPEDSFSGDEQPPWVDEEERYHPSYRGGEVLHPDEEILGSSNVVTDAYLLDSDSPFE